jgi:hypothetical protein
MHLSGLGSGSPSILITRYMPFPGPHLTVRRGVPPWDAPVARTRQSYFSIGTSTRLPHSVHDPS